MASPSRLHALVKDAIAIVMRRLATLPPSPEVDALRGKAEGYERDAASWVTSPPTVDEREKMMKRVLRLHIDVAKLEQKSPGP